MGNLGSLVPGTASASLACNSTTSVAVRVRVRLCVEAEEETQLAGTFVKVMDGELKMIQRNKRLGVIHMTLLRTRNGNPSTSVASKN